MANTKQQDSKPKKLALGYALSGETVILLIGPDQKKYCIHRAVLTHHSEYFRNALKGPWKEADEGIIPLADVEVETFDLFAQWLYTQQLFHEHDINSEAYTALKSVTRRETMIGKSFWRYLKAFVFGDRFLAHGFRRAAHEKFSNLLEARQFPHFDTTEIIRFAFANVPSHHPFLQQLADEYRMDMCYWRNRCIAEGWTARVKKHYSYFSVSSQESLPVEFLIRVNIGIQRYGSAQIKTLSDYDTWNKMHCYFEHATDDEKKGCKKLHLVYDKQSGYRFYPAKIHHGSDSEDEE